MVTWLVVALAWAAPQTISLEDVLAAAGDLSATPYSGQLRSQAGDARLRQARSPDELTLRLMERGLSPSTAQPVTELRVRMPIEAFGLIRARADRARATGEVETWEAEAFRLEAQASAHLAFLQIQTYSDQLQALEAELAAHGQRVKLFEQRLASGLSTTDVHAKTLGDQLSARREAHRTRASLLQSRLLLTSWTRLDIDSETEFRGPAVHDLAAANLADLHSYLSKLEEHPQLRLGQARVQASEAKQREEAREALPSIRYLQADGAFEGGKPAEFSAMVGVDVPLFAGARADVSLAGVSVSKAQARAEQAAHQLTQQVSGQWHHAAALQQLWREAEAYAKALQSTLEDMAQSGDPVAIAEIRVRSTRARRRAQEDLARYLEAKLALGYSAAVGP
jgi:outer membrane protein TolC